MHLRNLFTTKYGKEFVAGAMELRPDSGVNRTVSGTFNMRFFFWTSELYSSQSEHLLLKKY
jgi:vacuolar protein sorting-associated protein IST1